MTRLNKCGRRKKTKQRLIYALIQVDATLRRLLARWQPLASLMTHTQLPRCLCKLSFTRREWGGGRCRRPASNFPPSRSNQTHFPVIKKNKRPCSSRRAASARGSPAPRRRCRHAPRVNIAAIVSRRFDWPSGRRCFCRRARSEYLQAQRRRAEQRGNTRTQQTAIGAHLTVQREGFTRGGGGGQNL